MRTIKALSIVTTCLTLCAPIALAHCGGAAPQPKTATVQAGPMPAGAAWDGVYFNRIWGYLHIRQDGTKFIGRWKTADESAWGQMSGTVDGNVVHFEWVEHKIGMVGPSSTRQGHGVFQYSHPEGENVDDKIIGQWGFDESEIGGGEWDAVKQRNVKPDVDAIRGDSEPTVGDMK